jgi:hypothetical protein
MRRTAFLILLSACTSGAPSAAPATPDPNVLSLGSRRVAELVAAPYDPAHHRETFKVYHHVYGPGDQLLTKGLGGEFEHHRGLFLGWNRIECRDQKLDFWHGRNGERQEMVAFAGQPGSQTLQLDWRDKDGNLVLHERRELRVGYLGKLLMALDGPKVIDWDSTLTAGEATVVLAGDPQHAGQQFRALDAFSAADGPKLHYVRPEGAKAHANDIWTDCAWTAAILPMPQGPVTVLRVELPGNPTPTWSTRDYGRFGATWTHRLQPGESLRLRVAYAVIDGERDAAWCAETAGRILARGE